MFSVSSHFHMLNTVFQESIQIFNKMFSKFLFSCYIGMIEHQSKKIKLPMNNLV